MRSSRFDQTFDVIVMVLLSLILLITFYPLYFIVIASISDPGAVMNGRTLLWPAGINFKSYEMILNDARILTGYYNTVRYALFGTLIGLIITIPAGYALSIKTLPGIGIITKLMVFTMYFSGGLIPTYLVVKGLGLINTPYVLMIVGSFSVFNMIITRTYFATTIPPELYEAAEIDGCSAWKFFFLIVVPLSQPIIAVISLYYAVAHWNSFFSALIYVSKQSLYPLQLVLRDILVSSQTITVEDWETQQALQNISQTIKYGIIVVSSLPVIIIYPFLQRYFVKGIMIGSVKG
ncbi:MAG: carbohydrate ABC transporter permease [Treponema sp.]|nr:carbohydrate ABC transporter permease [Treponema sp.]